MNNMINFIKNFNNFSDNRNYKIIYYFLGIISFILSYISQLLTDKKCKSNYGESIRIVHHFLIFFIYFGFLAPISILNLILILVLATFMSWLFLNNHCVLTILENKICNRNSNHIFHDLTYFISKSYDKFLTGIRLYLFSFYIIIILARLYVNYKYNKVVIQGHRGARGNYPENSLSAFKYALDNSIDVLEMDLQLTKDKKIVIYHDKRINLNICNGMNNQEIKKLTLQEIKEYECGSKINPEFPSQIKTSNEKIITLEELIEFMNKNNYLNSTKLNVEIKTEEFVDNNDEIIEFTNILLNLIKKYNLENRIVISSFDIRPLKYIKQIDEKYTTAFLLENTKIDDSTISLIKELKVNIFSPEYILLNKNIVDIAHKNNIKIITWTINNKKSVDEMIEIGVDGIITDYPVEMQNYINNK
jgi:glycerophosphoryl diester phosphodiesterase